MNDLGQELVSNDYLRKRLDPMPGDRYYIHLSDLLMGMRRLIPDGLQCVLDFGSGGSPYRSLFSGAGYHRADVPGVPGLDYLINENTGLVNAPDSAFDCVLSSQVLEHVPDPIVYLKEAYRVLQPGGRLIISTHGIWEDHPCPYDYWRWTNGGLEKLLLDCGFSIEQGYKATTGSRAALALVEDNLGIAPRRTLYGLCLWPLQWLLTKHARCFHIGLDAVSENLRLVPSNSDNAILYIALLYSAIKTPA